MSRIVLAMACVCGLCAWSADGLWAAEAKQAKKVNLEPIDAVAPAEAAADAKFRKALDETAVIDFTETPLREAMVYLADHHKIDIQLDRKALEDASIGDDTPVTRHLRGISLRSALRIMLGAMDLTYIIKNEILLITTPDKANNELRTKVYPVSDLTMPAFGKVSGEEYMSLMNVITTTVSPTTWDEVGGPGSVTELRKSRSLVISATQEVHEQVLELLTALRQARDGQPPVPQATALESIADSLWTMTHPRAGMGAGARAGMGSGMGGGIGGMGGGTGGGIGGGMFRVKD